MTNLQLQSKNAMLWLDIYQKEKIVHFAKTISFIFRKSDEISCKVEVTGKRVTFGDGEELQITCKLYFTRDEKYIDKLFYFLPFLIMNGRKSELKSIFLP